VIHDRALIYKSENLEDETTQTKKESLENNSGIIHSFLYDRIPENDNQIIAFL
jgi:hypothetical protein